MKDRIVKSIFWIVWSRVGLHGLSFLSTLLVLRILTPADYGLMALAGVWIYILSLIVEVDLGAAIIQFPDLDSSELNACFWLTTCLTLLGCGFLIFASPHISNWFAAPRLTEILPIVAVTLPLAGAKVVPYGLLKKGLELDKISKTEIAASAISIPIVLSMAWYGAGVWALVAGTLVPLLVQTIGSFWYVRWRPGFQVSGKRVRQMVEYSLVTTFGNVLWALTSKSPALILGKVSGEALLGIYTLAMELATTFTDKISLMVNQLAFPVLANVQTDVEALRHFLLRAIRLIVLLTAPLSIGTLLVAEDFVFVMLTEKWSSVVPVLQILSIYALCQSLLFLFPVVLKARYRVSFLFYFNLVALGVMPISFLIGAWFLGPIGVASAWLIYVFMTMCVVREVCREVSIGWGSLWQQISSVMKATLCMCVVVLLTQWFIFGEELVVRITRMVLAICLGGLSYVGVMLLQGGQVIQEAREVAGWIFGLQEPLEGKHLVNIFYRFLGKRKESCL